MQITKLINTEPEMVTITFAAFDGWLGLTLEEPVAADKFKLISPGALPDALWETLTGGGLDRSARKYGAALSRGSHWGR